MPYSDFFFAFPSGAGPVPPEGRIAQPFHDTPSRAVNTWKHIPLPFTAAGLGCVSLDHSILRSSKHPLPVILPRFSSSFRQGFPVPESNYPMI
jgi:hypothetical protein